MTVASGGVEELKERAVSAIVAAEISDTAKEEAGRLVEAWIDGMGAYPDSTLETIAVECPFYFWLGKTVVVGVQDRLARDEDRNVWGCEWKSRKEPRMKKDGTPYKGDSEEDWLREISGDIQLRIYALAMRQGTYRRNVGNEVDGDVFEEFKVGAANPCILVRAAVKSSPVQLWPVKPEDGMFTFPSEWLDRTRAALTNAGQQIRAARRAGGPWALPSLHCTNKHNRTCDYHESYCSQGIEPELVKGTTRDSTDPGWAALKAAGADLEDPEVVVLSASSYGNWLQCPQQYKLLTGGMRGEESEALGVGMGLHRGLGAVYGGRG